MFESIYLLSKHYPLNTLCRVLNVNKSSYLYWLNHGRSNAINYIYFLQKVISVFWEFNGLYGAPKITIILNRNGIICSISKVSRAMSLLGIRCIISEKFPHKSNGITNDEKLLIVNLIKNLNISRINQVWTTDITYIKTINDGTFFLITFIDLFSRKVVSWGTI